MINEYKYSWYYPSLQVDACHPTYNSNLRHLDYGRGSTAGSIGPRGKLPAAARHGLPTKLMKDKPMELILIILLLVVLFGGGFGFYRGGYYRQGGPVGIGGILGLIIVVLAIGWLVHGHIGGLSL
jgi:NhaP-type Na+/H+ or K+/H+ antiporter